MKNTFKLVSLSLTFILLLLASVAGAVGGTSGETASDENADWVQYSSSHRVLVPMDIVVSADVEVVGNVAVIHFDLETGLKWVRCCRFTNDKDAWCDRALQHKNC